CRYCQPAPPPTIELKERCVDEDFNATSRPPTQILRKLLGKLNVEHPTTGPLFSRVRNFDRPVASDLTGDARRNGHDYALCALSVGCTQQHRRNWFSGRPAWRPAEGIWWSIDRALGSRTDGNTQGLFQRTSHSGGSHPRRRDDRSWPAHHQAGFRKGIF